MFLVDNLNTHQSESLVRSVAQACGIKEDLGENEKSGVLESQEGRAAFLAFREQKRLAQAAPGKLNLLAELLARHAGDRILIFTADNATVYKIARRFLIPAMTNQTRRAAP